MTLDSLLARYIRSVMTSTRYQESLRRTVRRAAVYGLTQTCQLTPDAVNEFLEKMRRSGRTGDTTRHNIRRELLTLWRYAFDEGITKEMVVRVRKVPARFAPPTAYSFTDLVEMLRKADLDQTPISTRVAITRREILPVWLTVGYETGLRLGDLLKLRTEDYRNGCLVVRANKTGKVITRRLSAESQKRFERLCDLSPDGSVFLWALPRRRAIHTWKAFLSANGYQGGTQWLRRSGATHLDRLRPGMATLWLDHSNPQLARKHYIDGTLIEAPPTPPPLEG